MRDAPRPDAPSPETRLESGLFGDKTGACPEVYRPKLGKFEFANAGTIFLARP
ncbi:MAG: sigma 54-interacting transcriptional regulator [Candidatus Methylomirabilia bacterium]